MWVGLVILAILVLAVFMAHHQAKQDVASYKAAALESIDDDDDEDLDDNDLAPAQFRIRYMDEHGQRTQRAITLHKFGATDRKFVAHCHLRHATRDFLFSRVIEAVDLDTGEVLPKAEFFRRVKRSRLP